MKTQTELFTGITIPEDLTTATAAAIDGAWAPIEAAIKRRKQKIHNNNEILAEKSESPHEYDRKYVIPKYEAENKALGAEMRAFLEALKPLSAEFRRRGGWTRYFLVTSSPHGHVHRETWCSTCHLTTEYSWLTELSDCDEAAMVAKWGEKACTTCFPDAPTMRGYGDGTSEWAKEQAKRNADYCSGVGQPPSERTAEAGGYVGYRAARRFHGAGKCVGCGKTHTLTQDGTIGKHKSPEAIEREKAEVVCEGSGQKSTGRYDVCHECGKYPGVTQKGLLRKHRVRVVALEKYRAKRAEEGK